MFGTQIKLVTLLCIGIQLLILFEQFLHIFKRKKNGATKRFFWFTALFILYNLCSGLFPDKNIPISIYLQNIIAYSVGIILAIYYVWYVYKEFHIVPIKFLSIKNLIIYLSSTFIALFVIPYLLYHDLQIAKKLFIVFPILIALLFLINVSQPILRLYKNTPDNKYYRNRIFSGYLALLSIVFMPIIVAYGDLQTLEQSVVNAGYFWLAITLLRHNIYQSRKRDEFLLKLGYLDGHGNAKNESIIQSFKKLHFSEREIEIANFILDGYTYKEIGHYLFIAEGTVSKHASNIFKKTNTNNKKAFVALFSTDSV